MVGSASNKGKGPHSIISDVTSVLEVPAITHPCVFKPRRQPSPDGANLHLWPRQILTLKSLKGHFINLHSIKNTCFAGLNIFTDCHRALLSCTLNISPITAPMLYPLVFHTKGIPLVFQRHRTCKPF